MAIVDSGERTEFSTGAVRDMRKGKGRCDLMPLDAVGEFLGSLVLQQIEAFKQTKDVRYLHDCLSVFKSYYDGAETMFLEVAKHFEDGAEKYGESNWQHGIPVKYYIDSAVRHYLKYRRGDKDEPHDRAFVWNILCCMWTCKHKPELWEE